MVARKNTNEQKQKTCSDTPPRRYSVRIKERGYRRCYYILKEGGVDVIKSCNTICDNAYPNSSSSSLECSDATVTECRDNDALSRCEATKTAEKNFPAWVQRKPRCNSQLSRATPKRLLKTVPKKFPQWVWKRQRHKFQARKNNRISELPWLPKSSSCTSKDSTPQFNGPLKPCVVYSSTRAKCVPGYQLQPETLVEELQELGEESSVTMPRNKEHILSSTSAGVSNLGHVVSDKWESASGSSPDFPRELPCETTNEKEMEIHVNGSASPRAHAIYDLGWQASNMMFQLPCNNEALFSACMHEVNTPFLSEEAKSYACMKHIPKTTSLADMESSNIPSSHTSCVNVPGTTLTFELKKCISKEMALASDIEVSLGIGNENLSRRHTDVHTDIRFNEHNVQNQARQKSKRKKHRPKVLRDLPDGQTRGGCRMGNGLQRSNGQEQKGHMKKDVISLQTGGLQGQMPDHKTSGEGDNNARNDQGITNYEQNVVSAGHCLDATFLDKTTFNQPFEPVTSIMDIAHVGNFVIPMQERCLSLCGHAERSSLAMSVCTNCTDAFQNYSTCTPDHPKFIDFMGMLDTQAHHTPLRSDNELSLSVIQPGWPMNGYGGHNAQTIDEIPLPYPQGSYIDSVETNLALTLRLPLQSSGQRKYKKKATSTKGCAFTGNNNMQMVVYKNKDIVPSKQHMRTYRAKVPITPDTRRVWLLLENGEHPQPDENLDRAKEWESRRAIMKARVDGFIRKMRAVQGNRQFSRWKGSIVDSVIGTFLTQNVSDHLSSSAFMSVASRFPSKAGTTYEHMEIKCENQYDSAACPTLLLKKDEPSHDITACICDEQEWAADKDGDCGSTGSVLEQGICEYVKPILQINEDVANGPALVGDGSIKTTETLVQDGECGTIVPELVDGACKVNKTVDLCVDENISFCYERDLQLQTSFAASHEGLANSVDPAFGCDDRNLQLQVSVDVAENVLYPCLPSFLSSEGERGSNESVQDDIMSVGVEQNVSVSTHRSVVYGKSGVCRQLFKQACVSKLPKESRDASNLGQNAISIRGEGVLSSSVLPAAVSSEIGKKRSFLRGPERGRLEEIQGARKNGLDVCWKTRRKQVLEGLRSKTIQENQQDMVDWDSVRCIDVEELAATIKERGMHHLLSGRIKGFLKLLHDELGSIDLEWLRHLPSEEAREYLISLRGLGVKSVECIRLLALHHLAFPVDTNVGRICVRLGWVPIEPLPEELQLHLLELYPIQEQIQQYLWPLLCVLDQETLYELHYHLITFGKVFCTKRKPNCNACPMQTECKYFASAITSAKPLLTGSAELHGAEAICSLNVLKTPPPPDEVHTSSNSRLDYCPKGIPVFGGLALVSEVESDSRVVNCPKHVCVHSGSSKFYVEEPPSPEHVYQHESDLEDAGASLPFIYNDVHVYCDESIGLDDLSVVEFNACSVSSNMQCTLQETNCKRFKASPTSDASSFFDTTGQRCPNTEESSGSCSSPCATSNLDLVEVLPPSFPATYDSGSDLLVEVPVEQSLLVTGTFSNAIIPIPEAANNPAPKLKNVSRLCTIHYVYELPDGHPLLETMEARERDDPCSYLLAIWSPGEVPESQQEIDEVCMRDSYLSSLDHSYWPNETVSGTLLIPCRTAMHGSFPLNGTYFQVNEVFADHESSLHPLQVPRSLIWNLPRRFVYFGTSIPNIFKGLSTVEITSCFWRGHVCMRGFDRKSRAPKPLVCRLHFPMSKQMKNKRSVGPT